jgi:hypothetical protein
MALLIEPGEEVIRDSGKIEPGFFRCLGIFDEHLGTVLLLH